MKPSRHLLYMVLWAALAGLPVAGRAAEPDAPAVTDTRITPDAQSVNPGIRSYTVVSEYQKGPNKVEVLLPDAYTPEKQYPVVYLLPVNTGTSGQWGSGIVEARKANLQNAFGLIFVAPAYDTQPWFGDNPLRPDTRQDSYLLKVVLPFIDKEFSTVAGPGGRLLIGFSKSGLGAWQLFLLHLDLFGQVATFDSYQGQPTQEQWNTWGFADTYGTRENFDAYDPPRLLDQQKQILQQNPRRITLIGGGPGVRVGVDWYRTKLEDYKIPHIYIHGTYMQHNWYSGWLPLAVTSMMYPEVVAEPK